MFSLAANYLFLASKNGPVMSAGGEAVKASPRPSRTTSRHAKMVKFSRSVRITSSRWKAVRDFCSPEGIVEETWVGQLGEN